MYAHISVYIQACLFSCVTKRPCVNVNVGDSLCLFFFLCVSLKTEWPPHLFERQIQEIQKASSRSPRLLISYFAAVGVHFYFGSHPLCNCQDERWQIATRCNRCSTQLATFNIWFVLKLYTAMFWIRGLMLVYLGENRRVWEDVRGCEIMWTSHI